MSADLSAILNKLNQGEAKDGLSSEKTSQSSIAVLDSIQKNIREMTAISIDTADKNAIAARRSSRQIAALANVTAQTGATVTGSQSRFNLSSLRIDPETGSGVATALAFSTFPGLAKLYVRGVEALAKAFSSIEPKHLEALEKNAGSFEAMTTVIGTVQALNFKDLLGASVVLRMTAGKLGENLGSMFVNLMDGIDRGMPPGMLQDLGNNETPLSKITDSFSVMTNSITSLMQINGLKLLGQTLLFRMLAGQIGRNIGFGFVKLVDGLPPQADLDKIKDGLKTVNSSISKLDIFENINAPAIIKGFGIFESMSNILSKIKAKDFTKLNEILGAFWGQLVTRIKHLKETLKQIKSIPDAWWTSFSSGMSHLYAAGQKVKKLRVDTFKRFPKVVIPFSGADGKSLIDGFKGIRELSKVVKATKFISLNAGLVGLLAAGVLLRPVIWAFSKIDEDGLKGLIKKLETLSEVGPVLNKIATSLIAPLLKFLGLSAIVAGSLAVFGAGIAAFSWGLTKLSEGISNLVSIKFSGSDVAKLLGLMGGIAAFAGPLALATPLLGIASLGLMALGAGLRSLTKDVNIDVLREIVNLFRSFKDLSNISAGQFANMAIGVKNVTSAGVNAIGSINPLPVGAKLNEMGTIPLSPTNIYGGDTVINNSNSNVMSTGRYSLFGDSKGGSKSGQPAVLPASAGSGNG